MAGTLLLEAARAAGELARDATPLEQFRKQYPQYDDLPDLDLATRLHERFYQDIPFDEFSRRIGLETNFTSQPLQLPGQGEAAPVRSASAEAPAQDPARVLAREVVSRARQALKPGNLPEARALPDEPSFAERLAALLRPETAVTPETQFQALTEFEAMQQGLPSGKALRERIKGPDLLERGLRDFASGAVATGAGLLGFAASQTGSEALRNLQDAVSQRAAELLPADPQFLDQLAAGFGSTTTFFIPGLGVAKGASALSKVAPTVALWLGSGASAGLEAAAEAGDVYQTLREQGHGHEEAARRANQVFWQNAALVGVTDRFGLFGEKGRQLLRRTLTAVIEGGQEAGQQVISNIATDRPIGEGVGEAAAIGGIVGGALGGGVSLPAQQGQEDTATVAASPVREGPVAGAVVQPQPGVAPAGEQAGQTDATAAHAPEAAGEVAPVPPVAAAGSAQEPTAGNEDPGGVRLTLDKPGDVEGVSLSQGDFLRHMETAIREKRPVFVTARDGVPVEVPVPPETGEYAVFLPENVPPVKLRQAPPVPMKPEFFGSRNTPLKTLRARARDYVKRIYRDGPVRVQNRNQEEIIIGLQGAKHGVNSALRFEELAVVQDLPGLISRSELVAVEPDRGKRDNILNVRIYRSMAEIGEDRVPIRIVVRETRSGRLYYDHSVFEKDGTGEGGGKSVGGEKIASDGTSGDNLARSTGRSHQPSPEAGLSAPSGTGKSGIAGARETVSENIGPEPERFKGAREKGEQLRHRHTAVLARRELEHVLARRAGIGRAMNLPGLGRVAFSYGDRTVGFERILLKHGAHVARMVPDILAEGKPGEPFLAGNGTTRRIVEVRGWRVVLEQRGKDQWSVVDVERAEFERKPAPERNRPEKVAAAIPGRDGTIAPEPGVWGDTPEAMRESMVPGRNYVPLTDAIYSPIRDLRPLKRKRDKPIRREDVLKAFLKGLNTRIFFGHMGGRNALGYFVPKSETVRVKNWNDLEVAAHELGHLIDFRSPGLRRFYTRHPVFKEELRGVSYDDRKIFEGFAEFVRLWMTQPARAVEAAPNFTRWWEGRLKGEKGLEGPDIFAPQAILDAREKFNEWFAQDAIDRMRSKIGASENVNEALDAMWDRFRQSVTDDLFGILKMERELTGKAWPQPLGPYETARTMRGAEAVVHQALLSGAPVRSEGGAIYFEGRGLKAILDPVADDIDNWTAYAVARSAAELKEQGRENLFTQEEIEAGLALETPVFRQVFDEWLEWNQRVLDFAQSMGLVSAEQRKRWQRQQYLPFYRVGERETGRRGGIEGNVLVTRRLTGGSQNLRDILDNMVQNSRRLIVEAIKNEARMKVIDFARKTPGGGQFIAKVPKRVAVAHITKDQVLRAALEAIGLPPKAANLIKQGLRPEGMPDDAMAVIDALVEGLGGEDMVKFWLFGQNPKGDDIIAVLRNGKPEFYQVSDPLLLRAISAFNRPGKHPVVRLLSAIRRIGQGTVTLTLDFMLANIWRDTIHAWVFSQHGFKPVASSLKGFVRVLRKDEIYRLFIANGGGMASYLVDEGALRRHLEKFYTKQGIDYRTVIDTPGKLMFALESLADAFEMSSRVAEFELALKRDEHPRHAAYLAREISADFAMRGDSEAIGFFYDTVMFLKAGVNGMDRFFRGVTQAENRAAVATKIGVLAVISVILKAWNMQWDCYNDLEDWDKDTHWHVLIPKGDDCREFIHLRFPKIWEVGAIASAAERTLEAFIMEAAGAGERTKAFAGNLFHIMRGLMQMDWVPAGLEPIYEVYALNRNRFTQRPIVTEAMKNRQPAFQYDVHTSRTLVRLGELAASLPPELQISPARAEALIRGYFNTWGMYGLMLADSVIAGKELPERRLDQYPGIRRFIRQEPGRTRFETEFYDMLEDFQRLNGTVNHLTRFRKPELKPRVYGIEQLPVATSKQLRETVAYIRDINRRMEAVYLDRDLSPKEKREKLDQLRDMRNRLFKAAARGMEAVKQKIEDQSSTQ